MTQAEQHHKALKKRLNQFEEQFQVTTTSTGHETTARENGGIHEEEYWVKNLITSPAQNLNIKTGGWFTMDTRGEQNTLTCRLTIKINGDKAGDQHKALVSRYHEDQQQWGELRWTDL